MATEFGSAEPGTKARISTQFADNPDKSGTAAKRP
jgi:hypothetical protein